MFLSSESALQIATEMIHYGMTKTALLAVSRGLAETLAGTGGATEELEANFLAEHRPTSLIKRLATVEEVANMVVYLASMQASATTGAALRVDGGGLRSIA